MSHTLRIRLTIGVIVVLLVVTPFLIPVDQFRPAIEQRASAALGRRVDVGRLRLSLLSGSLSAETLTVGDDPTFSTSPFITAKSVTIGVELLPLIMSRSLEVTDISIENPEVTLIRNSAGQWNYSSLGSSASASGALPIRKLVLKDGRVIAGSKTHKRTYQHVNVAATDVWLASTWPVIATAALPGGGTFSLVGDVGPVDQADPSLTPLDAIISVDGLNLATTGVREPAVARGGRLDLKATIVSRRAEAAVGGNATLSNALLVAGGSPASRPVLVEFNATYDLLKHSGTLNPSTVRIGGASARLNGIYNVGAEDTVVNITIVGGRMPASDLESMLPALGIHLPQGAHLAAGTFVANLNVAGAMARLVATGNVGLFNARLTGFDLGSKMRAISAFTGLNTGKEIDIAEVTTHLRVAADGLRFDHLTGVVPSLGHLIGAGTIDAKNNLHFGMVATVASAPGGGIGAAVGTAGALNEVLGILTGGNARSQIKGLRIPFLVQGPTSNPQFVPDVSSLVMQTLEEQLGTKP